MPLPYMTISDGVTTLSLPDLVWIDEYQWSTIVQSVERGLTGSLIVHQGTKLGGRKVTLEGGETWAWVKRLELTTLKTFLESATSVLTLTLIDDSTISVLPDRDGDDGACVVARPLPVVAGSESSTKTVDTIYIIDRIKFMEA